jgi:hypothetical protein
VRVGGAQQLVEVLLGRSEELTGPRGGHAQRVPDDVPTRPRLPVGDHGGVEEPAGRQEHPGGVGECGTGTVDRDHGAGEVGQLARLEGQREPGTRGVGERHGRYPRRK